MQPLSVLSVQFSPCSHVNPVRRAGVDAVPEIGVNVTAPSEACGKDVVSGSSLGMAVSVHSHVAIEVLSRLGRTRGSGRGGARPVGRVTGLLPSGRR